MQPAINIVIPMAGLGSRFSKAGYTVPKPFIEFLGKTMIQHVLENLRVPGARYILIVRKEHAEEHGETLAQATAGLDTVVIPIDYVTEGQACSVLLAHRLIGSDVPLLIANSDQVIDMDVAEFIRDSDMRKLDGSILTFHDTDPKWSFARTDSHGIVVETREKVPISPHATVGIYYFAKGSIFVQSALDMMLAKDRVNNEYYACPVYNYAIRNGHRFGIFEVDSERIHGTGTPEDLDAYIAFKTG